MVIFMADRGAGNDLLLLWLALFKADTRIFLIDETAAEGVK